MAWGPIKGHFAAVGLLWFSVGSSVMRRERERRGAVIKDGAWFGIGRRYWRERGGGVENCCEDKRLLDMWGVPTYDSKFTFFPNR